MMAVDASNVSKKSAPFMLCLSASVRASVVVSWVWASFCILGVLRMVSASSLARLGVSGFSTLLGLVMTE